MKSPRVFPTPFLMHIYPSVPYMQMKISKINSKLPVYTPCLPKPMNLRKENSSTHPSPTPALPTRSIKGK